MTQEEFRQEVLQSDIAPENFNEVYNEFVKLQELSMDTLRELHRVCELNKINYQMAFGSLLGVIRDNGQIPWDYDVDVLVPYNEKDKLISALKKDLSDRFYFYCPEVDEKCRHAFMRIAPKGYSSILLHVDVFYWIGTFEDAEKRMHQQNELLKYFQWRFLKLVKLSDLDKKYKMYKIKLCIQKMILSPVSTKKISNKMNQICLMVPIKESKKCLTVQNVYRDKYFETVDFLNTRLIVTDKGEFRIPVNFDGILRRLYKNYEKVFPLENRLSEMLSSYSTMTKKQVNLKNNQNSNERYYVE